MSQPLPASSADLELAARLYAQMFGTHQAKQIKAPGAQVRRFRTGQAQLSTSSGKLVGWAFTETSGVASASLRLWDGRDNAGDLLLPLFTLTANESARDFPPHGIQFDTGIFLEVVSGSIEAAVYIT